MTETITKKYKLSVGAIFKNEEDSIVEWIEHYLHHGVEHFYLIDDSSYDTSVEKIEPYIKKNIVTLFNFENYWEKYLGRQKEMCNFYILPIIKETQWLLMIDLDEYVWSPKQLNLCDILMNECIGLGQIQIETTVFGSSGLIEQPKNVVGGFTMRSKEHPTVSNCLGGYKYFINSDFSFKSLNIHHATFTNKDYEDNIGGRFFIILTSDYFILNHYTIQSLNFWNDTKCTRGDCDNYRTRDLTEFYKYDLNEVEDTRLYEQNKEWLDKL